MAEQMTTGVHECPGPGTGPAQQEPALEIRDLVVEFATGRGYLPVVGPLDLTLPKGRTLGLVGESGSGKTVTALSVLRLIPEPPGRIPSGQVLLQGQDLLTLREKAMADVRGRRIAMIFQEPMTSLDPAFTVGAQISEVIRRHKGGSRRAAWKSAVELLGRVGIPSPERRAGQYPHAFSGGMRQRVMIAMAVSCQPDVLIADEPTTALDVTVQAQILDLLKQLQADLGMSMVFVTHDLGVVADVCDDVAVMYAGQVVESGPAQDLFEHPQHPYTEGLLQSMPKLDGERARMSTIGGVVPSPDRLPQGCRFHPRCRYSVDACVAGVPDLRPVPGPDRLARCIRAEELELEGTR
ncbi:ABC transporter ATP-binding protein [Blastococcus sp. SYSU DS0616]